VAGRNLVDQIGVVVLLEGEHFTEIILQVLIRVGEDPNAIMIDITAARPVAQEIQVPGLTFRRGTSREAVLGFVQCSTTGGAQTIQTIILVQPGIDVVAVDLIHAREEAVAALVVAILIAMEGGATVGILQVDQAAIGIQPARGQIHIGCAVPIRLADQSAAAGVVVGNKIVQGLDTAGILDPLQAEGAIEPVVRFTCDAVIEREVQTGRIDDAVQAIVVRADVAPRILCGADVRTERIRRRRQCLRKQIAADSTKAINNASPPGPDPTGEVAARLCLARLLATFQPIQYCLRLCN
jgi:hypothetical protein